MGDILSTDADEHLRAAEKPATAPPVPPPSAEDFETPAEVVATPTRAAAGAKLAALTARVESLRSVSLIPSRQTFQWRSDRQNRIIDGYRGFGADEAFSLHAFSPGDPKGFSRVLAGHRAIDSEHVSYRDGPSFLLSASPTFTPKGQFSGYVGNAVAATAANMERLTFGVTAEDVADLAHEVRTPLNVIRGYAELIESTVLAPEAAPTRADARQIIQEAERMLTALDMLGEGADLASAADADESVPALDRLSADLMTFAQRRNVRLSFEVGEVAADLRLTSSLEQALRRFATALIALASPLESLSIIVAERSIELRRPSSLRGLPESALLSGKKPTSHDQPLLGTSFTLRLVRRAAERAGGRFTVEKECFRLTLPDPVEIGSQSEATPPR
ncbi:MAG: histidine kinase dimerization/phospho-acceptor domain-containing protein [Pacificimonas sp.]